MKKYLEIYSVLLLFVFTASCNGQSKNIQPKDSISQVENSLPDSIFTTTDFSVITIPNAPTRITRNISQKKDGNLLFAAFEDIIQYDGKTFTNFTKEAGLDSCDAFDVLEDKKGNIWITHSTTELYKWGLSRYDAKSLLNEKPTATEVFIGDGMFFGISEDREGCIWVGTLNGVFRYDPRLPEGVGQGKSINYFRKKDVQE